MTRVYSGIPDTETGSPMFTVAARRMLEASMVSQFCRSQNGSLLGKAKCWNVLQVVCVTNHLACHAESSGAE